VGLWKTVRREVAGAWRSARYDVDRHVGHHRAIKLQRAETAEIVVREIVWQRRPSPGRHHRSPDLPWAGRRPATSVQDKAVPGKAVPGKGVPGKAMPSTALLQKTGKAGQPRREPRRRAVATTGVALLVAGGAAGTYLAVAGSLAGVNANASGSDPVGTQPMAAVPNQLPTNATTPKAQRNHRRAAAAPAKPADIRPVVPPPLTTAAATAAAPTPTQSIEATPTPSETPTPSPSVSPTTTDEADAQFTDGHRWRHRGQTHNGR